MRTIVLLMALALLLPACSRGAVDAGLAACGTASTPPPLDTAASWGPDVPVFLLHADGRLERGNLRASDRKLLGEHGFESFSTIGQVTPDQRWLVLSGRTERQQEIWTYDTATGSERLLFRREKGGEALPHLSPDSRSVAVFANYSPTAPDPGVSGLFVFDLASGMRRQLPLDVRVDPTQSPTMLRWSADSESLYLFMWHESLPEGGREIYRVHMPEGRFERIEGQFDGKAWEPELRVAGQLVPLEPHTVFPSRFNLRSAEADDHAFVAGIDAASQQLRVRDHSGRERTIAKGHATDCGNPVSVTAWVGHFLIYELDDTPYLYDADRNRTRRIGEPGDEYFWFTAPGAAAATEPR